MKKVLYSAVQVVTLFCALQTSSFAAETLLTDVQVDKSSGYASFIFNLRSPQGYKVFTLHHPNRIVVDIRDGHLRTSTNNLDLSGTPVTSVRHGRFDPHTFRVVLDVNGRIPKFHASLRDINASQSQLVLDVYGNGKESATSGSAATSSSDFSLKKIFSFGSKKLVQKHEEQVAEEVQDEREKNEWHTSSSSAHPLQSTAPAPKMKSPMPAAKSTQVDEESKTEVNPSSKVTSMPVSKSVNPSPKSASFAAPKNPANTLPNVTALQPRKNPQVRVTESVKQRKVIVVIDAGHGGKDPGTVGRNGMQEKNVVLSIAIQLANLINQQPNMHAVLTRDGDYFVTLRDRLRIARKAKGDLFVAIHADSYFNNQLTGASVYALSQHGATTEAARWLARRENYSELGGVALGNLDDQSYVLRSVLIDLAQTATISDSIKLGSLVLDDLEKVTTLHYTRVEQAPFMVLKSPDIPSVLVETGFLSNPSEEARLNQANYRKQLARAILNGIRQYVATHPTMTSTPTSA